jgi:RNA polymerase sigma-70 factor, ECF subfamily
LTTLTVQTREDTRLGDRRDDIDAAAPRDFNQIVALHHEQVSRLAHRLLGWRDRDAVDDVVQEVFLVALRRLKSFRGDSSLRTWLMGITINECRSYRRRSVLRLTWLRDLWSRRNDDGKSPLREETSRQVRDAVAQLPPRDREVIVLFYLEGLSVSQIAQLVAVKNNAIEVRLHRARQRLKTQLAGLIGD